MRDFTIGAWLGFFLLAGLVLAGEPWPSSTPGSGGGGDDGSGPLANVGNLFLDGPPNSDAYFDIDEIEFASIQTPTGTIDGIVNVGGVPTIRAANAVGPFVSRAGVQTGDGVCLKWDPASSCSMAMDAIGLSTGTKRACSFSYSVGDEFTTLCYAE